MLSLRLSKAASGLPISAAQLAKKAGMQRPVSLRELLTSTGTRTRRPRVCVLRYEWKTAKSGGTKTPKWPDSFLNEVLSAPNGWSLRDYWYRASQGLLDIDFVVQEWKQLPMDQSAAESQDRGKVIQMCKDQGVKDQVYEHGSYDNVIAFLYPSNNPAGASGRDAVLDQSPFSLEFYQHEMGHALGFDHAYGTAGDYVYEDGWCVMGFSGPHDHPVPVPAGLSGVAVDNPGGFWKEGRRLSSAALFRYDGVTDFSSTPGVIHVDVSRGPQTVRIVAASASDLYDPVVAVVTAALFKVTVEFRIPTGDDAGIRRDDAVRNAIIVHSIGRREVLRWQTERDPVWLEAEIPADPKLTAEDGDSDEPRPDAWIDHGWKEDPLSVHVELLSVNGSNATVRISRAIRP